MYNIINHFQFTENLDYKELSPKDGKYKYKFVTLKDINIEFSDSLGLRNSKLIFKDSKDRIWLTIIENKIVISKNYAWDGCTPKKWWGIWWGSPDFEKTILASLIHDVLLQFHQTDHFPISRYDIDLIFKEIMNHYNFIGKSIYYLGARFGSVFLSSKHKNVYSQNIPN